MYTLDEIVKAIQDTGANMVFVVLPVSTAEGGGAGPGEPPEPEGEGRAVRVTAEKTLARFAPYANKAGKPVLEIYPSETSPARERIRFERGAVVAVYDPPVSADGGLLAYELVQRAPDGTTLYVLAGDVS